MLAVDTYHSLLADSIIADFFSSYRITWRWITQLFSENRSFRPGYQRMVGTKADLQVPSSRKRPVERAPMVVFREACKLRTYTITVPAHVCAHLSRKS